MSSTPVIDDVDVAYWRGCAERAEARAERAEARAERAEARAERAEARVVELEARIEELSGQVAVLSRMLFGRSSEKDTTSDAGQNRDQSEDLGGSSAAKTGQPGKRGQRAGSKGHGRRDYSHLDTREIIHDLPEQERTCGACRTGFEPLGYEDSEQIDWQVSITRIVHRRCRYRRRCGCRGARTVIGPVPAKPVPKGRFTPSFLARLLFEKYVLGRPLHRIAAALAAEGFQVAQGTLSGALKDVHALLEPLYESIKERNALTAHAHVDETTWRVFERVEGKDGTRWWLWVFVADDTTVFIMDPARSATVLDGHLGIDRDAGTLTDGRRLVVSSDFYAAYQSMARVEGVDPLWCWAHIRRYFIRAGDAHPQQLGRWRDAWIDRIAMLYATHRDLAAAEPGTPGHRAAGEAFDAALAQIDTARRQVRGPGLHPAARKVLETLDREWEGLARHRDFPDLALDNNAAERALRTPVIGRKNYYGAQAEWAAHLAAAVWTITGTAERNGREPLTYLIEYLQACAAVGGRPPDGQTLERFLVWRPDHTDTAGSHDHDSHNAIPDDPCPAGEPTPA